MIKEMQRVRLLSEAHEIHQDYVSMPNCKQLN